MVSLCPVAVSYSLVCNRPEETLLLLKMLLLVGASRADCFKLEGKRANLTRLVTEQRKACGLKIWGGIQGG